MHDSAELLRRYAQHRDQDAFAALVDRHAGLVYSVAVRQLYGDAHLAKDVTQKVFVDLARKASELQSRSTIDGWLYRASYLTAAATIRGEQRRKKREEAAQVMEKVLSDTASSSDWADARPALDQAINELAPRDRDAVLLRFYERLSFDELGRVLNLSPDGARMRVERALQKMRATLARHGLTSTAAALAIGLADQAAAALPAGLSTSVTGAALTAAKTAGTSLLARTITFMSVSKIGLGVAGLLTLVGISSAVYEGRIARQAEVSLAAAADAHQSDQAKIKQLTRQIADDDQKWDQLQKTVSQMQAAAQAMASASVTAAAGPAGKKLSRAAAAAAARQRALADGQAFLNSNPQARDILTIVGKAQITSMYGPFFRAANLTSAQVGTLVDETAAQWLQTLVVTPGGGVHPSQPQLPEDQIEAIVGPAAFQQFQDFERVQPLVGIVNQASGMSNGAPLTAAQTDQVLQIVANASTAYQNGGKASANTVDWNQVATQLQGILASGQIAGLNAAVQLPQLVSLVSQFYKSGQGAK